MEFKDFSRTPPKNSRTFQVYNANPVNGGGGTKEGMASK